jgi:hypothetical protein
MTFLFYQTVFIPSFYYGKVTFTDVVVLCTKILIIKLPLVIVRILIL